MISTAVEHPSVLGALDVLEREGRSVTRIGVTESGQLDLERLLEAIDDETGIVSVMAANNETGAVNPLAPIREACERHGVLLHVDAVQGIGRIPCTQEDLGADLITLSGHKLGGPIGAAALSIRRGLKLQPLHAGGHQERGVRAGTENTMALAGLGAACAWSRNHGKEEATRLAGLRDRLLEGLQARVEGVRWNGGRGPVLANTLNVGFQGCPGDQLLIQMDMAGISASSGSACTSGTVEPSHVLKAMGQSNDEAREAIRFSLGHGTTADEIERVLNVVPRLVEECRAFVDEGSWESWEDLR